MTKMKRLLGLFSRSTSPSSTNAHLRSDLAPYADIAQVSEITFYEEDLKLINKGATQETNTQFSGADEGVHIKMAEDYSLIAFNYCFGFTINNERYLLTHCATLEDWKTDPKRYQDYLYKSSQHTKHQLYRNFEMITYWAVSRLLDTFESKFGDKHDFIETLGEEKLDELKKYLTFVVQADYI